jgi:predicted alpha/beta hydrolase family esterase
MKKQVVIIHGGETFASQKEYLRWLKGMKVHLDRYRRTGWKENIRNDLGKGFDVILPQMPNKTNARYAEWSIVFKKIAPLLQNNVVLVGHSLGGTFLAKYLAENKFPKKIRATFLIAAPFDDKNSDDSLADFALPKSLARLAQQGGKLFIWQSQDDPVVPFADFYKYVRSLPTAQTLAFKRKSHFNQEHFPELAQAIRKLF